MSLFAGTGKVEIIPDKPMFLYGYPHVERISEGVHDPIYASTLLLDNEKTKLAVISLDILMISPWRAREYRRAVASELAVPETNVFISCTHTHSGPISCRMFACGDDPVVPEVDEEYLDFIRERLLDSVKLAAGNMRQAQLSRVTATVNGVGCNRRHPDEARDPEAGVLLVRDQESKEIFGMILSYCMHPTVLHEDSKLISADFPGYTRTFLQEKLGRDLVVVYQVGPEGNQSPRYHVKGQTFAEAERLGYLLGEQVWSVLAELTDDCFSAEVDLAGSLEAVSLDRRRLPSVAEAEKNLENCRCTYEELKRNGAAHGPVRTAECSVFGAEETLFLARCQENGSLDRFMDAYRTVDIQVLKIGTTFLVGWPGEIFVEYGLELKKTSDADIIVSCLVNGELQGYLVTPEAMEQGGYEATNTMFSPESGRIFINTSLKLIEKMKTAKD